MRSQMFIAIVFAFVIAIPYTKAQNDGILIFWGGKNFTGEKWDFHRTLDTQYCYNDNVGKPSSITWKNQPKIGIFDGKAKIAFYTEHDCKGRSRAWFTTEKNFPRDLYLDGIDNQIKSFMLLQSSKNAAVNVRNARVRLLRTE